MATSKKELEKTKELARLYYLNGDTQKLVAEKVGVSRVTINKWVNDGGWDALRTAKSITRKELVAKIDAGDSSVQPYMDFAHQYPVRDSMRMMRLLYRLGLGSQENKQEQLLMFSRTISTLQNKAREQKYKERLEKMENKTMMMLFGTGGGILGFLLLSMMMMMSY